MIYLLMFANYLVKKTMLKFHLTEEQATRLLCELDLKDEIENFEYMIDKFNSIDEIYEYYGE